MLMNPKQDAYGQEVWHHYNQQDAYEIVEREDGYIDISSGPVAYFADYPDWEEQQQKAMDFVQGNVLDIGCGAGRHLLYLQERGFKVTGIDQSPLAVKVCRERGLEHVFNLSISEIRTYKSGTFDTILMMGNNFGLFGNFSRAQKLLHTMHRITTPDAYIIAESNDPYKTDNPDHAEYREYNKNRGRMAGQLKIRVRFKKYKSRWFDYLLVSQDEMEMICTNTGWQVKEFINSDNSHYIGILEKC